MQYIYFPPSNVPVTRIAGWFRGVKRQIHPLVGVTEAWTPLPHRAKSERRCIKVVEAMRVVAAAGVAGCKLLGRRGAVCWWAKVATLGMALTACSGRELGKWK